MLGEPELDRGRGEPSPVAITPCPPVPFVAAGEWSATAAGEERPSRRTALAIAVVAIAIVTLGAFLVTGGGAKKESGLQTTLPGSAEVARVTAPNAPTGRVHPASPIGTDHASGHGKNDPKGSGSGGKHHPAFDDPPADSGGTSGDGGGTGGDGGGDQSKPLATVDLPVVGTVTVDEPKLPPLPDVDGSVPDVPDIPGPDVDLP